MIFGRGGLCTDSPDNMKKTKATINPKNKEDNSFQYAETVALNYEEIKWNPERASNIKTFVNKYNWKGINYPSQLDDCKTFEKKNPAIALNILYINEKEICPAYISKINSTCEKQIIILKIPNKEKEGCHYLAAKKIICIITWNSLRMIFIAWIVFILLEQKINLSLMKNYVETKIFVEL